MLKPTLACMLLLIGCHHDDDPGFEIVRVPKAAYSNPSDAAALDDGALLADGGREPMFLCLPEVEEPAEGDEVSDDYPHCLLRHEDRAFDKRVTERHRNGKDAAEVCCYGRAR